MSKKSNIGSAPPLRHRPRVLYVRVLTEKTLEQVCFLVIQTPLAMNTVVSFTSHQRVSPQESDIQRVFNVITRYRPTRLTSLARGAEAASRPCLNAPEASILHQTCCVNTANAGVQLSIHVLPDPHASYPLAALYGDSIAVEDVSTVSISCYVGPFLRKSQDIQRQNPAGEDVGGWI
jgi:hypothetical protein